MPYIHCLPVIFFSFHFVVLNDIKIDNFFILDLLLNIVANLSIFCGLRAHIYMESEGRK